MESKAEFVVPEWMTWQQINAINRLYNRNSDGCRYRSVFFSRVGSYGDYCGLRWCNMFIGIEKDGYTHS